jgi:hypothetical protein
LHQIVDYLGEESGTESNNRSPSGMTTRKATAKKHYGWALP